VQRSLAFDDDGAGLDATELGNGPDGGSYFADGRLFVQAFAANGENGGAAIRLDGLTLEAGVSYTVRFERRGLQPGLDIGRRFPRRPERREPGIADPRARSGPGRSPPRATTAPIPMRFETRSFEFTPSESVADPYLLLRTDGVSDREPAVRDRRHQDQSLTRA
jgi:hypothetical protein